MIEDEKIIEMFFERSEQGIRELDIKYGKVCHKLSYNIVNSRQDAEECVNDAYLGAWNAIPPANPHPLLTYICKIVRNISLKIYYRKEAAKRNSTYTIAMEEIEACIADPNTVEAEIEARELARIIESFLDTLTVENRVIFMRRYWFSDSCKDIAEFVGLSEKNISVRLTRIRQDAEECVNDAYLGAWNAIPPANPHPLLTYICKIVRNISLKIYYRKEAAKRNSTYTIAMEEIEACIADPNTVEAEIEARELARIIESFLDTLTVENRVIFMRRYWFSDSCKDIAEFVGLSEKNISVRLTRIRQKMKSYLAEREVFV